MSDICGLPECGEGPGGEAGIVRLLQITVGGFIVNSDDFLV